MKKQSQRQQQEWIRFAHRTFLLATLGLGSIFRYLMN